ncbi:hypothetical protein HN51_007609 [Arachis hypogaea]
MATARLLFPPTILQFLEPELMKIRLYSTLTQVFCDYNAFCLPADAMLGRLDKDTGAFLQKITKLHRVESPLNNTERQNCCFCHDVTFHVEEALFLGPNYSPTQPNGLI